jgi:toxin ParE1/3/4
VKRIEIRGAAVRDIDSATEYYGAESTALAERWLDTLRRAITYVQRHPTFGSTTFAEQVSLPGIRHRPVSRFPYLVFYVESEHSIVVVRVLHERRDVVGELESNTD